MNVEIDLCVLQLLGTLESVREEKSVGRLHVLTRDPGLSCLIFLETPRVCKGGENHGGD